MDQEQARKAIQEHYREARRKNREALIKQMQGYHPDSDSWVAANDVIVAAAFIVDMLDDIRDELNTIAFRLK